MPSNLNALVRYKQIDKCLRNKFVNCTIEKMQKMCSEQLGEYRGVYKLVSERTIRDDIKTMRGDSLGFNAPIVVKHGVYNYSEDDFSIFNSSINDMDLLKKVMLILLEEKDNISNPDLDSILHTLSNKTGITLPKKDVDEEKELKEFEEMMSSNICHSVSVEAFDDIYSSSNFGIDFHSNEDEESSSDLYLWKEILELI